VSSYAFDYTSYLDQLLPLLRELERGQFSGSDYAKLVKKFPKPDGSIFSKNDVIQAYRALAGSHGLGQFDPQLLQKLQMKPTRTISGVSPITVLTKPFPCPGKCIFCPNDVRMPKSYLSDEPGAQRAERNFFDPYLQTYNRLQALHNIGHPVSKAELIVLGGTWSFYSEPYQIWFIKECFRALNDFGTGQDDRAAIEQRYAQMNEAYKQVQAHQPSNDPKVNQEALQNHQIMAGKEQADSETGNSGRGKTYNQVVSELYVAPEKKAGFDKYQSATWPELEDQQKLNETAVARCVGLVIETRPDSISVAEVRRIRRLGCTKTQIGVQSLQDSVLVKNRRGHDVAATRRAFALLRQAGFKIHAHWMANLYGSSVELDKQDYDLLFEDPDFKPDELKIYPCSLIASAELLEYYKDGRWRPYSHDELLEVVTHALANTPLYCRLTRVIRDIPSTDIVSGNKLTNFRQIAQDELRKQGVVLKDIRAREIRGQEVVADELVFEVYRYQTSTSEETFLQYLVGEGENQKLVGFLRLSLPKAEKSGQQTALFEELNEAALIREIHVYGPSVRVGVNEASKPQHLGVGRALIEEAKKLARQADYRRLSVISAIGTREYYRKQGFSDGELYQHLHLE